MVIQSGNALSWIGTFGKFCEAGIQLRLRSSRSSEYAFGYQWRLSSYWYFSRTLYDSYMTLFFMTRTFVSNDYPSSDGAHLHVMSDMGGSSQRY